MVTDDGDADVINVQFEQGFVINTLDFNTSHLVNQDRIGTMNYLMVQFPLLGRMIFEENNEKFSMVPGDACIYYPPNQKQIMDIPTHKYRSIVIGLNLDKFELKNVHPKKSREILEEIKQKYRIGERRFFKANDRIMVEVYALNSVMDNPPEIHDNVTYGIVSDLFYQLYRNEIQWCTMNSTLLDKPEDKLYGELLKEYNEGKSIENICDENDIDRFSINHAFREMYGNTPLAFMKHHRMLRSAGIILLGQKNMKKVSELSGYDTESKFAKSFKNTFGFRPKHFREEFLKDAYTTLLDRIRTYHNARPSFVFRYVASNPVCLLYVLFRDDILRNSKCQNLTGAGQYQYLVCSF